MLAAAVRDCTDGKAPWPIFAHGPAGVGKTCAGLYLADRVMGSIAFMDFAALCDRLTDIKCDRDNLTATMYWKRWAGHGLCVLDEVGLRNAISDHQYECLQRSIDLRTGKPLLVLSNLDLDGIAQLFDDRIASRLAAGTVVHLDGPDQRMNRRATP